MASWNDRFQQLQGKTRFVVCRLMLHLAGREAAPLLGVMNQAAQQAIAQEGDLNTLGEGLVEICQSLLQYDTYWRAAANEGDVFWNEGEAGDYVNELFTDSAQRYQSGVMFDSSGESTEELLLTVPVTENLIVMLTVAYTGESPDLETDLSDINALKAGLKAMINLQAQERLRAIQVHFAPAQLGDALTSDDLLVHFAELVPL
jgi:uncharacterized membrane protein